MCHLELFRGNRSPNTILQKVRYSNVGCSDPLYTWILRGYKIQTGLFLCGGRKEVGLPIVQNLNGIWNLEAQLLEIWTNGHHFVKNHLKSGQKWLDLEMSGFQMVGALTIVKPSHSKSDLKKSVFTMVRFQIPTILKELANQTFCYEKIGVYEKVVRKQEGNSTFNRYITITLSNYCLPVLNY